MPSYTPYRLQQLIVEYERAKDNCTPEEVEKLKKELEKELKEYQKEEKIEKTEEKKKIPKKKQYKYRPRKKEPKIINNNVYIDKETGEVLGQESIHLDEEAINRKKILEYKIPDIMDISDEYVQAFKNGEAIAEESIKKIDDLYVKPSLKDEKERELSPLEMIALGVFMFFLILGGFIYLAIRISEIFS